MGERVERKESENLYFICTRVSNVSNVDPSADAILGDYFSDIVYDSNA